MGKCQMANNFVPVKIWFMAKNCRSKFEKIIPDHCISNHFRIRKQFFVLLKIALRDENLMTENINFLKLKTYY
jgi:hypothetical protein